MSKVTADQVANFLEEEAYRIRTVSFFDQRKTLFNDDLRDITSESWAKYLVAKEHSEEDKRMICVIRGEFSVNALYGGRQPVVFDKSVEYYARKMLLRIGARALLCTSPPPPQRGRDSALMLGILITSKAENLPKKMAALARFCKTCFAVRKRIFSETLDH